MSQICKYDSKCCFILLTCFCIHLHTVIVTELSYSDTVWDTAGKTGIFSYHISVFLCIMIFLWILLLDNVSIKSNVQGIYTVYIKFTSWKPIIALHVQGLSSIQAWIRTLVQYFGRRPFTVVWCIHASILSTIGSYIHLCEWLNLLLALIHSKLYSKNVFQIVWQPCWNSYT